MANDDTWHKLEDVKDQFVDEGVYNLLQKARLKEISQKVLNTVKELLNVDAFEMWFYPNQTVFVDYVQINLITVLKKSCTLYELLKTNLIKTEEVHVSKSMTHQEIDLPINFLYWADFYQLFEKFEECVKKIDTRYTSYNYLSNDAIRSHQTLVTKFKILGDDIFAKRVFKDIILNFDHRPNQDINGVAYVGGVLPHDGDLFYVVSQNDSTNNSNSLFNSDLGLNMIHLMEVKTRASLPIDSYKGTKQNYNWLLFDIYHGIKEHNSTNNDDQDGKDKDGKDQNVIGLSKQRVNCLVSQMKKMMRSESNNGFTHVYSLLSTFEATFVLFYDDDGDSLWISRPLPREKLLLAMYFVLLIQLRQRNLYKEIPQDLLVILNDLETNFQTLPSESDLSVSSNSSTITQSSTNSSNNTTLNDTVIHSVIAQSLSLIWKKGPKEMIGSGRTCFVVKVSYKNRLLALKMIYLYRNPKGSLEELENEKDVMEWINLNTKLSIVPIVHYYGNISLYRTLAMDYVDGECFHDFSEMTLPMIEACDKSVLELHKCRVLHGDLQPWNFILRRAKNTYKAHIIDFGRGRYNASADDLNTEYVRFCIDANIKNRGMNPSANRPIQSQRIPSLIRS